MLVGLWCRGLGMLFDLTLLCRTLICIFTWRPTPRKFTQPWPRGLEIVSIIKPAIPAMTGM